MRGLLIILLAITTCAPGCTDPKFYDGPDWGDPCEHSYIAPDETFPACLHIDSDGENARGGYCAADNECHPFCTEVDGQPSCLNIGNTLTPVMSGDGYCYCYQYIR